MGPHFYKIFKGKKAKCGKKRQKCPALLRLLYFLPLITGAYDLTIASVVSVLGYYYICVRNLVFSREFAHKFPLPGGNLKISEEV